MKGNGLQSLIQRNKTSNSAEINVCIYIIESIFNAGFFTRSDLALKGNKISYDNTSRQITTSKVKKKLELRHLTATVLTVKITNCKQFSGHFHALLMQLLNKKNPTFL